MLFRKYIQVPYFTCNIFILFIFVLGVAPKPNRNHVPSSNGCGSLGLKINSEYLPFGAMESCCNAHDICYDTCNKDKDMCDLDFKRCLYKQCDEYSGSVGGPTVTKGNNLCLKFN